MSRLLIAILAVLALAAPAQARAQAAWDNVARVVVIGDLHGNYAKFHNQLIQAGLIDAKGAWSGGAAHLVQLGDVPDRGADTRKILDLLARLEPQAKRAGGFVHALIGNHEAMNMEGDLRYVTAAEYAAFADRKSPRRRDAYYKRVVAALQAKPPASGLPVFDAAHRARFDAEYPLGWVEHRLAWAPNGIYGRRILTHSAVIRIDDTLYLHAGLGPQYLPFSVEVMNSAVVNALSHKPQAADGPPDILWHEEGPLWYRGLANHDEAAEAAHAAAVLARHKVRRVVIGHSKRYGMINARFGGSVILTDIAVPTGCADPHAFLIKEGERLSAFHAGQKLEFPAAGPGHADYLARVEALIRAANPDPTLAAKCLGLAAQPRAAGD